MTQNYTHKGHAEQVIRCSKVTKMSTRAILGDILRRAEHDRPEVTFTKTQLMETINCCRRTVQLALRELRAEGTIEPIRHFVGGRGNATTYRIHAIGEARERLPVNAGKGEPEAGRSERSLKFQRLAAKHGAIKALDMMGELEDD